MLIVLPMTVLKNKVSYLENELYNITVASGSAMAKSKRRILLVDDEKFNLLTIKEMLERINCDVFTAENGIEALKIFESFSIDYFDTILTDLNMPHMNGKTLIEEIGI